MAQHDEPPQTAARSALDHYLARLRPWLDRPGVTELCINGPGRLFIEHDRGWECIEAAWVTQPWALSLARLIAASSSQRIAPECPLLSTSLPSGERVQAVIPPAVPAGSVSITLRKPSAHTWTLEELHEGGLFDACTGLEPALNTTDEQLSMLYRKRDFGAFLKAAVRAHKNILISGATGSGKTTLTRALIREIPNDERIIAIEDAAELDLTAHANSVRLLYSKDGQGLARVTPKQLLESCLRMRPDRILLAELRGAEAYEYLRNVNSGHPGSITSIHAGSTSQALEQLALLVAENPAGSTLPADKVAELVTNLIDVVVQCVRAEGVRRIQNIRWQYNAVL